MSSLGCGGHGGPEDAQVSTGGSLQLGGQTQREAQTSWARVCAGRGTGLSQDRSPCGQGRGVRPKARGQLTAFPSQPRGPGVGGTWAALAESLPLPSGIFQQGLSRMNCPQRYGGDTQLDPGGQGEHLSADAVTPAGRGHSQGGGRWSGTGQVCMHVSLCLCVHVHVCLCACACICLRVRMLMHVSVRARVCACARVHACMCLCVCAENYLIVDQGWPGRPH